MNAMMRLALLLGLVVSCVNAVCPPGFVASVTIPGKCYHLTTTSNKFFEAINYCRNLTHGADILAIANGFENSEVATLLSSRGVGDAFIGNAFYDNKSHWITTAAGNSNYSNWPSGSYNGLVTVMYSNGSWSYAYTYHDSSHPICQIYPDDPTTFPPPQITCPSGWTPSISARGKCYKYIGDTDFFSAIKNCQTTEVGDSHAELVTLVSQFEMMELYVVYERSWVSMTNSEADGAWHWVDTLHPTDYFGPNGSPTPSGGNCAYTWNTNLYGILCSDSITVVCQYFVYESPTSSIQNLGGLPTTNLDLSAST